MNVIIVGCGRIGSTLANELSDAGHNVAVIDRDNDQLNVLGSGFNGLKIKGVEYDGEILQEAGISSADTLLAMTPDENVNITVALIAKKIFHVPRIIARNVNPNRRYIYERLDIETVCPTKLGADIIKAKLSVARSGVIAVINRDYQVVELLVGSNRSFSVRELEKNYGCIISAVLRGESLSLPGKDDSVMRDDRIVCTIGKEDLKKLISAL